MSLVYRESDQPMDYNTSTYPFFRDNVELPELRQPTQYFGCLTLLGQGDQIRHVLHEDPPLELKFGLATLVDELLVGELVLRLAKVNVFAAK